MTFKDLLIKHRGNVDDAVNDFISSNVLITVPHAYTKVDINHSKDLTALENAQRIHQQKQGSLLHVGNVDRRVADLNRETKPQSRDYHYFIELWIKCHPEGELIDVHSYPPGFNWKNETTTLEQDTITTDELVCLLPVKNQEYAKSWEIPNTYEGTYVNKIINMGCNKSILLEFNEKHVA